jgi:small-conductance mechanosensitive channel
VQVIDQNLDIAEASFNAIRFVLRLLIFLGAVAACRWSLRTFLLSSNRKSARWLNSFSAGNLVALIVLRLLRDPAEKVLTALGEMIGRLRPASQSDWPPTVLVGLYYALIATSVLFAAFYVVGLMYRFGDRRVDAWQSRLRAGGTSETSPRFHVSRIIQVGIHVLCTILSVILILVYFFHGFRMFPRTRIFVAALIKFLGPPLQDASKAFENYVPNLSYIFVILVCGWILLKALKYFFTSIQRGKIVFTDFPVEWAEPTYKLSRAGLFLLVLVVSFPYLPGANTPLFRGFSLFFGALLTFGSSGFIGNLLAGILLTYQQAFRLGDVVRIEGTYGRITKQTLLITRLLTVGNEHVVIPNSKVLAASVTNYSAHSKSGGFALGITATIGYEIDSRVVRKLLLDGAARTEQIATDSAPRVLVNSFGNYSVEYELRTWTKNAEEIFDTCTALRLNVLDAFADAGIEIMTPAILSHRDASELAVPTERFPSRPKPEGIRISVDPT